jgi:putative acetyltransferase
MRYRKGPQGMSRTVTIQPGDPRSPGATALLKASHALMQSLFSAEANHYLSIDDLCQSDILFFTADLDGETAGCAALALRSGYGEVKSMFVDPGARGAKIGSKLLDRLESEAIAKSLPVLRLETGEKLVAAHKLYTAQGFKTRGPFGDYPDEPTSLYMEKWL